MIFSSAIFLFCFLPFAFILYFAISQTFDSFSRSSSLRFRNFCLFCLSLIFYTKGEGTFVLLMLFSGLVDFFAGLAIEQGFSQIDAPLEKRKKETRRSRSQKIALYCSLCANLGILAYFKYSNFFISSIQDASEVLNLGLSGETSFLYAGALPLGISFYTFQSMSYTIDIYRGNVKATSQMIDYLCYVTAFPQLVAGPIVRYKTIAEQLHSRTTTIYDFAWGAKRFVYGLAKKLIIADSLAAPVDAIFQLPADQLTTQLAWIGITFYTLQIYFDFSGYSDMAIGLGRIFGFKYPENFSYPYFSRSIREFWRRWHITLSTWFRDYLYIPLGGNRGTPLRTTINLFTVFILCGLWHGASYNFLAWGLAHGFLLSLERTRFDKFLGKIHPIFQHIYVLIFVVLIWVLFRTETLIEASNFYSALFGIESAAGAVSPIGLYVQTDAWLAFIVGSLVATPLFNFYEKHCDLCEAKSKVTTLLTCRICEVIVFVGLFFTCAGLIAIDSYSPFIYFRF